MPPLPLTLFAAMPLLISLTMLPLLLRRCYATPPRDATQYASLMT